MKTLKSLRVKIQEILEQEKMVIMVTHMVTINAITGISVSSGGGVA